MIVCQRTDRTFVVCDDEECEWIVHCRLLELPYQRPGVFLREPPDFKALRVAPTPVSEPAAPAAAQGSLGE
jgi:hypothetical protein